MNYLTSKVVSKSPPKICSSTPLCSDINLLKQSWYFMPHKYEKIFLGVGCYFFWRMQLTIISYVFFSVWKRLSQVKACNAGSFGFRVWAVQSEHSLNAWPLSFQVWNSLEVLKLKSLFKLLPKRTCESTTKCWMNCLPVWQGKAMELLCL